MKCLLCARHLLGVIDAKELVFQWREQTLKGMLQQSKRDTVRLSKTDAFHLMVGARERNLRCFFEMSI